MILLGLDHDDLRAEPIEKAGDLAEGTVELLAKRNRVGRLEHGSSAGDEAGQILALDMYCDGVTAGVNLHPKVRAVDRGEVLVDDLEPLDG